MYLTREQIVDELYGKLLQKDKEVLSNMREIELSSLHHGYGTWIRNTYKLWEKDHPLTKEWHAVSGTDHKYMDNGTDCHPDHPDQVSFEIIKDVHKRVKQESELLSFDAFWQLLKDKGYQYGFDAADNAYFGYKLAHELMEVK